jgi:hypothetical protein
MTVYVDDMFAPYRGMKMSHMIADTEDELHAMADRIGVARRWYQGDHYDICQSKRQLAIQLGAIALNRMQLGRLAIAQRRARRLQAQQSQHQVQQLKND